MIPAFYQNPGPAVPVAIIPRADLLQVILNPPFMGNILDENELRGLLQLNQQRLNIWKQENYLTHPSIHAQVDQAWASFCEHISAQIRVAQQYNQAALIATTQRQVAAATAAQALSSSLIHAPQSRPATTTAYHGTSTTSEYGTPFFRQPGLAGRNSAYELNRDYARHPPQPSRPPFVPPPPVQRFDRRAQAPQHPYDIDMRRGSGQSSGGFRPPSGPPFGNLRGSATAPSMMVPFPSGPNGPRRPHHPGHPSAVPQLLNKPRSKVAITDILREPGRSLRHPKIVIILRGPPGAGKSYLAKLIKDEETKHGKDSTGIRMFSIDEYFMVENENAPSAKSDKLVYEYDPAMEAVYLKSLQKSLEKTLENGLYSFIIVDAENIHYADYAKMVQAAKPKGFQVYVADCEATAELCAQRNIHGRTKEDIEKIMKEWEDVPPHIDCLDCTGLLQHNAIEEVEMGLESSQEECDKSAENSSRVLDGTGEKDKNGEEDPVEPTTSQHTSSKWELLDAEDKLDKLDGIRLKRHSEGSHEHAFDGPKLSIEEFLELSREQKVAPGKLRVRWADIEEMKKVEKEKSMGFVVGQTNWKKLTGDYDPEVALKRTKYF